MSLKKQYLKTKPLCNVTFNLNKEEAPEAKKVHLVGDFNNWDVKAQPMKKLKNGKFTATLPLEKGREYQFRYLVNLVQWVNDWEADTYRTTPYGNEENSVVIL